MKSTFKISYTMTILKRLTFFGILALLFTACNDDDSTPSLNNTFSVTIENVVTPTPFFQSGTFKVPVGGTDPAPIFPGDAYEFTVQAGPSVTPGDGGTRLSFATMFVQSNDLFLAPDESGIELYDGSGNPIGGGSAIDVTNQVLLWDSGTEVNDITGSDSQKPQQGPTDADVGTDENGVVTEITGNSDGTNDLPNVADVVRVTITNQNGTEFLVRIENVSDGNTIATPAQGAGTTAAVPMSPGVYVVHTADNPLFTTGQAASEGIEDIAEDGFFEVESARVEANTGLIVPMSPGVWAVHDDGTNPLFNSGEADFGEGLEAIAEDGVPTDAAASLKAKTGVKSSDLFDTPVGATAPSAIGPGGSYQFTFEAESGDRLSLTTMFVQSNDWIYTFPENGIALYNGDTPLSGDVTSEILLYDAGTEVDEYPGAGLNQVIRQSSADAGAADADNTVRRVTTPPSNVPMASSVIKVTVTPQ